MSDAPQGPSWWKAVDGKWYPPERWTGPPGTQPPVNPTFSVGPPTQPAQPEWTAAPVDDGPPAAHPTEDASALPWYRRVPVLAAAGVALFLLGLAVGAGLSAGDGGEPASGELAATEDAPANESTTTTGRPATTARPTTTRPPTTTTTAAPYVPTPEDFQIAIVEVERSCFGSAGCVIGYRIEPTYTGPASIDPLASFTVVYEVRGGEEVQTKNFKLEGGQVSFSEETIQTPPNGALSAVAIRVLEN